MNAIVYTRFIPRPDANIQESCETQDRICVEYAHEIGLPVAGVFNDPDTSGSDGCRPRLDAAIRSLQRDDVLLVYRWDCIASNITLALQYERLIAQNGAHVVSVTGDDPPSKNPNAQSARNILMAVTELERKMAPECAGNTIPPPQKTGRRAASVRLPYGWMMDPSNPKHVIPNEKERSIISKIVKMHNSGQSYTQIARNLNAISASAARKGLWSTKAVRSIYMYETASTTK